MHRKRCRTLQYFFWGGGGVTIASLTFSKPEEDKRRMSGDKNRKINGDETREGLAYRASYIVIFFGQVLYMSVFQHS